MVLDTALLDYLSKLEELIRKWWKFGSIGEDKGLVVEEIIIPSLMTELLPIKLEAPIDTFPLIVTRVEM